MATNRKRVINLTQLEHAAATSMQPAHYDYFRSGAQDESTLARNLAVFDQVKLRPRVLRDVSAVSLATRILDSDTSMPLVVAPTAFQKLAHAEGELATARAAREKNVIMTLSTLSSTSLEDVAAVSGHQMWFQLYVYRDREITRSLLQRAEESGYLAVVVTVDSPRLGKRERDIANDFTLPTGVAAVNLAEFLKADLTRESGNNLAHYIASLYDLSLTFRDLEWICGATRLPVLVKGVLRGDDALSCTLSGATGIVVSNHGGRQLDTAITALEALPEIIRAVPDGTPVLMDGGVRRGTDIFKALCLGARAVMLGRPILWGLAHDGERGVMQVIETLKEELLLTMQLAGATSLDELDESFLKLPGDFACV